MLIFLLAIYVFTFVYVKLLQIKNQKVNRTLQIKQGIESASFKIGNLLPSDENYQQKLFQIVTKELSPSLGRFAIFYQQGMLNKALASHIARFLYKSLYIEISHFAVYKKFDWYTFEEWTNILHDENTDKEKQKKFTEEQEVLKKKKDDFLKTTFPDFYDIICELRKKNKKDFF